MAHPRPIALVTTTLAPGGAERCLVRIARGLDRARFAPRFYVLQPPPRPEQGELLAELLRADVPVHFCHAHGVWDAWRVADDLRGRFVRDGIELIQTFLFHANVLGAFAAWRAGGIPIVLGLRAEEPSWFRSVVGAWGSRGAARIACVSQAVATAAKEAGFAAEKLVVIPNGIDVAPYRTADGGAAAADLPGQRRWLLVVGRLETQKGLDWLFREVLPPLFARLPDHDLAIAGEGPQREQLLRLGEELGIAARVKFLGWRGDVAALLARTCTLLLPSRWEGMPNVVLEAMAAGVPVVATDVAGVRELLGENAHGQVVAPGDAAGFQRAIIAFQDSDARRREVGEANRVRAEREFSLETMVARYSALYDDVLREMQGAEIASESVDGDGGPQR